MAVELEYFDQERRIVIFRAIAPWTLEDWVEGIKNSSAMIKESSSEFVIFDVTQSNGLPDGFLSSLQSMRNYLVPSVKKRFVVGSNGFVKAIIRVIGIVSPSLIRSFTLANSFDDALAQIAKLQKAHS